MSTFLALLLHLESQITIPAYICAEEQASPPSEIKMLTTGSRSLAASSAFIVFCTRARLLFNAEGKAFAEDVVVVGRFSYAFCQRLLQACLRRT